MHVSIDEFWKLAQASELLSADDCARLQREFLSLPDAGQANLQSLTEWLTAHGKLTRYQASLLAAGRPGPFVFGPFVVTQREGEGRLSRLFRARHDDGHDVLLVFLAQLTDERLRHKQLVEMAQAAAAVKSPHVSRTYGAVRHRGQSFIVVEGLHGKSLVPPRGAPLGVQQACQFGFQLALGLVAIHQQKLIHGRVCPHNIWIENNGLAKLLQFPLAFAADGRRDQEPMVDYLAPELADGGEPDSELGDIYALGCVLYAWLAGRAVFPGGTPAERLARRRSELPQPLEELNPQVSRKLAELLDDMLAIAPSRRCPSAQRVAHLLAPYASGSDAPRQAVPREVSPATAPASAPRVGTSPADDRLEMPVVVTDTTATSSVVLARRRNAIPLYWALAAGALLVVAVAVGALVANQDNAPASAATSPAAPKAAADTASTPAEPAHELATADVEDDPTLLWKSPTAGHPVEVGWVPNGAQVLCVMRLAELLNAPEGQKVVAALGPAGARLTDRLRRTLGVEPGDVARLTVAFVPDESTAPQASYVMTLAGETPREKLLAAWGNPTPAEYGGQTYFERNGRAYFFPRADGPTVVAVAPVELMRQVLETDGRPLLRSGIERLLASSDDARLVNVVFTPSYLLADGRELLAGELATLVGPIRDFLDPSIEAVLLSAHVDDALFVEFRCVSPVDRPPLEQLAIVRKRWDDVPQRVETHVASLHAQPYGSLLIHRFPRMLELARDFTRGGVEDGQVVLCTYLPAHAAHNLVLGAELTLMESTGAASPAPVAATADAPASIDEVLKRNVSLSFPRESLEHALELLAQELGIEIVILGSDLQLEGITKNQSLNNLDERDRPADAILRKILDLANPDGKLVYVIKPYGGSGQAVFITTRAAAAKRRDRLPEGF